jgi:hypothetical protein
LSIFEGINTRKAGEIKDMCDMHNKNTPLRRLQITFTDTKDEVREDIQRAEVRTDTRGDLKGRQGRMNNTLS